MTPGPNSATYTQKITLSRLCPRLQKSHQLRRQVLAGIRRLQTETTLWILKSPIATLVERTTGYVMLVHLPVDHTAESVRDGLIKTMSTLPAHLRGSLTWDQGIEMAKHKTFSIATDMDVYFCDPAQPLATRHQ